MGAVIVLSGCDGADGITAGISGAHSPAHTGGNGNQSPSTSSSTSTSRDGSDLSDSASNGRSSGEESPFSPGDLAALGGEVYRQDADGFTWRDYLSDGQVVTQPTAYLPPVMAAYVWVTLANGDKVLILDN
jgi:hypothetical protein